MLDRIKELDTEILLLVNGMHSDWLDQLMIFSSGKLTWLPLYMILVGYIIYKEKTRAWIPLLAITIIIIIADQFASGLMKPLTERLRPCHEAFLSPSLHLPTGCGGKYGFMSSHAANTFGVAVFLLLLYKKRIFLLLIFWAALVSYSRIYLGVHYLTDVTAGAITGTAAGYMIYRLLLFISEKYLKNTKAY